MTRRARELFEEVLDVPTLDERIAIIERHLRAAEAKALRGLVRWAESPKRADDGIEARTIPAEARRRIAKLKGRRVR